MLAGVAGLRMAFFMRRVQKIIFIFVILVMPVVTYLFLRGFGENKFTLPYFYFDVMTRNECAQKDSVYSVPQQFIEINKLALPMVIGFRTAEISKYEQDLDEVLANYRGINFYELPSELAQEDVLNCILYLGEGKHIAEPIPFKFVMVDEKRHIRGYYALNDLAEIERLDMELDILLNY